MTDLIVREEFNMMELFTSADKMDDVIESVRQKVADFKGDISTAEGRKEISSFAYKIARTKTAMDNSGKELTEDVRAKINLINAERNRVKAELQSMQDEVRKPLTDWENAEKDRRKGHEDSITHMEMYADNGCSSAELLSLIEDVTNFYNGRDWQEFAQRAEVAHNNVISKLNSLAEDRAKQEAEQAELARLRKEAAEREQKEREERIAREAAEKARIEAEAKAKAEADKAEAEAKAKSQAAEQERLRKEAERQAEIEAAEKAKLEAERKAQEAERRAKEAAENERRRIEAERQAEIEAEKKREANKAHKSRINNEALNSIKLLGLSEEHAKSVITEIAKGNIPHIKISY